MALTPEQDAEIVLRRYARDLASLSRRDQELHLSQELLLAAEDQMIGTANLLEAAADWIRDGRP